MARRAENTVEKEEPAFDTTPVRAVVRRMTAAEVDNFAAWVAPLIAEYWEVAIPTVMGWMRMWALDNQFSPTVTENAVGLAQVVHDPMCKRPRVEEVFLFVKPGHDLEGVAIYEHWARWGKAIGADEFRFNHVQGAPMEEIRKVFSKPQYRKTWYVNLRD